MSEPKTLLVRFAAIGDCVMAAWAATAIRNRYPLGTLDWAIESRCSAVVDVDRLVNDLSVFPRSRWKSHRWSPNTWREQMAHYARLRGRRYDLGFDLHGHSKTALCLYLAKPKRRIAAYATDAFSRRLNPLAGQPAEGVHMVEWFGQVINQLDRFELPVRPIMPNVDGAWLREQVPGAKIVSIAVGAGQSRKTVSAETWSTVGEQMRDQGWSVVYLGGPGESFAEPTGTHNLVAKTTLRELMSAVRQSDLLIAGDTGAGHVAASYGTPVVTIFASNDPRTFRPYTTDGRILKRGNSPQSVHPAEIVDAALELGEAACPKGS